MGKTAIEEWRPAACNQPGLEAELNMLAGILRDTVHAGASVSFVLPFSLDEARAFWSDTVLPGVMSGGRRVLVARVRQEIVGTVQLLLAMPPNQQHRAEVSKLLVHPKVRRRGIARSLMVALEEVARAEGRTLLTLDTRSGDAAEPLYRSMGYVLAGVIPRYARGPLTSGLEDTSILYKELPGAG
jgi:ribosomal protein S18 acetylase RimI-like enzyme